MRYTVYLSLLPLPCCVLRLSHGTYILSGIPRLLHFHQVLHPPHASLHCGNSDRIPDQLLRSVLLRFLPVCSSFVYRSYPFHLRTDHLSFLPVRTEVRVQSCLQSEEFFLQHLWLRSHTSLTFLFQYAFCNYRTQPCVS